MFCNQCGKELPEEAEFCSNCGASVKAQEQIAESGQTQEQAQEQVPVFTQPEVQVKKPTEKRKKSKGILIGVIVMVLFLLAGAVTGIILWNSPQFRHNLEVKNAAKLYEEKSYAEAAESYLKALEWVDDSREAKKGLIKSYLHLAETYYEDGQYSDALETYESILDKDEENSDALEGCGSCYLALGEQKLNEKKYAEALEYFEKAKGYDKTKAVKGNIQALYGMGQEYHEKGDYQKAGEYLIEALTLAEEHEIMYESEEDETLYGQMIETYAETRIGLGNEKLRNGANDEAEECFNMILDIDESCTEAYLGLAEVYLAQKDPQSAINILNRGIAISGDSALQAKIDTITKNGILDEKPDSISFMAGTKKNDIREDQISEWAQEYQKMTDVKLDIKNTVYKNDYNQNFKTFLDTDELTDVYECPTQYYNMSVEYGLAADLTNLVKQSGLYDKFDAGLWDAVSLDGRIYGIPMEISYGTVTYASKDLMDMCNISPEDITDFDSYLNLLYQFQNTGVDYPTVGVINTGKIEKYFKEFFQDATMDFAYVKGQWVDGMQQDNFLQAMYRMQNAYAEGLIDSESLFLSANESRNIFSIGAAGCIDYFSGNWGDVFQYQFYRNGYEGDVAVLTPKESVYRASISTLYCINGNLSEKEIEQIFNYFFSTFLDGSDGQMLYYLGIEGTDYNIDEEGRPIATENTNIGLWANAFYAGCDFENQLVRPETKAGQESLEIVKERAVYTKPQPYSETWENMGSEITALRIQYIMSIISGEISVESGLEKYVAEVNEMGMQQVLDEMNRY